MAKTGNLNIRIDPETKQKAEEIFKTWGITLSDAVSIFFNQAIMCEGLPFNMRRMGYNAETLKAIVEAKEIKNDPMAKRYSSTEELFAEWDKEDAE